MKNKHEVLQRIKILQKYAINVQQGYFRKVSHVPSEGMSSINQVLQQYNAQKGFWEKLTEGNKAENIKRSILDGVYKKYRNLLEFIQAELPELYEQHQGITFRQDASAEACFHVILRDLDYIKALAEHVIEKKTYLDRIGKEGIFFAGQAFDAWLAIASILESAQKELVIIDGYIDAKVVNLLGGLTLPCTIKGLISSNPIKSKTKQNNLIEAVTLFNKEYNSLTVKISHEFHDRFIFVDNMFFYHLGASINQAGVKKGFMFSRIEESVIIEALRKKFNDIWNKTPVFVEP